MQGKTDSIVYSRTDPLLFLNKETCIFLMIEILQNQKEKNFETKVAIVEEEGAIIRNSCLLVSSKLFHEKYEICSFCKKHWHNINVRCYCQVNKQCQSEWVKYCNYSVCLSSVLSPRPAEHLRHSSAQAGSYFKKVNNFSLQAS